MRKKKILFCSEASWLSTGYSVYTKEIMSRLNQIEEFDIAELACYCDPDDPNIATTPWKVYPNKPKKNDPSYASYKNNPTAQFGDQTFNYVMLDFQPDIVMDIRDWWMCEFEQRSPFRDFFHWALMPTVDAEPQASQWVNTYESADSIFTYSEFGRDVLLSQCKNINFIDVASPAASNNFYKIEDKESHKSKMGLSPSSLIIGTVMRNQKRKLYPDLFWSFRELLNKTNKTNLFLYCHTYYPDVGWDLPQLLIDHGLLNRVLLTYKCKNCKQISIDFFQNSLQLCTNCKGYSKQIVGIHNAITEEELNNIYNTFDIYVQYANSEGFGMPQLEAAYCGLPIVAVNYSAMKSVLDNINGFAVNPIAFSAECETGCKRAIPNNEELINILNHLTSMNKKDLENVGTCILNNAKSKYNWDDTANKWIKRFKSIELKDLKDTWYSKSRIKTPEINIPNNLETALEKTNFIFTSILHKPDWIGNFLWKKVLKDLTFGYRCENMNKDFYFNESHIQSFSGNESFTFEKAVKEMTHFRNQINEWEKARLIANKDKI